MPDPVATDPDDDRGGDHGRAADCTGTGGGRRSAAAAGFGRGRRAGFFADRDAVFDAGVLFVHGAVAGVAGAAVSGGGSDDLSKSNHGRLASLSTFRLYSAMDFFQSSIIGSSLKIPMNSASGCGWDGRLTETISAPF